MGNGLHLGNDGEVEVLYEVEVEHGVLVRVEALVRGGVAGG